MQIPWNLLGLVFLVSFGAAVAVIVLFTLGVAAISPGTRRTTSRIAELSPGARLATAAVCFGASALIVAYGVYVIVHK